MNKVSTQNELALLQLGPRTQSKSHRRIPRLEKRLRRLQQQRQIRIDFLLLYALLTHIIIIAQQRRAREHRASVAHEEIEEVNLTPFIDIDKETTETTEVRMNKVEASWADRIKGDGGTAGRERGAVSEEGGEDLDEGGEVGAIEAGRCIVSAIPDFFVQATRHETMLIFHGSAHL